MKKHSDEMFFHIAVCDAGTTNKPLSQSQIEDLTRVPSPLKCLRK